MKNIISYAKKELALLGGKDDPMQKLINKNILELIQIFAKQNHSGFSANYVLSLFNTLVNYRPLTPLTGEDDEWELNDFFDDGTYQNKRCSV